MDTGNDKTVKWDFAMNGSVRIVRGMLDATGAKG